MSVKICQICHRPHDGKYGSGRFCSSKCASKSRKFKRARTIAKKKRLGTYRKNFKPKVSKLQNSIVQLLKKMDIPHQTQYQLGKYYFDIKIGNVLLQVQGSWWHGDPMLYKGNQFLKHPGKKVLTVTLWKKDLKKKLQAIKKGYRVIYLWQSDIHILTQQQLIQKLRIAIETKKDIKRLDQNQYK